MVFLILLVNVFLKLCYVVGSVWSPIGHEQNDILYPTSRSISSLCHHLKCFLKCSNVVCCATRLDILNP